MSKNLTNNENTLPSAGTPGKAIHSRSHVLDKSIISWPCQKGKFMMYEILDIGEKNSLSSEYLKNTLGFSSIRALQKQIESERRQGKVILSSTQPPGGYYRPKDAAEVRRFIKTLQHRGSKTIAILKGAKQLLLEMEG